MNLANSSIESGSGVLRFSADRRFYLFWTSLSLLTSAVMIVLFLTGEMPELLSLTSIFLVVGSTRRDCHEE